MLLATAYRKHRKAKEPIRQLACRDAVWELRSIKARIEETLFKVQTAWKERNQDLAKGYMSDRPYHKHKSQIDELLKNAHKPMMFEINLKRAVVVEVTDFEDDSKDQFNALIEGSMIDYVLDEWTKEVVSGSGMVSPFRELWSFVRVGDSWVLDGIEQEAGASRLLGMTSSSEGLDV